MSLFLLKSVCCYINVNITIYLLTFLYNYLEHLLTFIIGTTLLYAAAQKNRSK